MHFEEKNSTIRIVKLTCPNDNSILTEDFTVEDGDGAFGDYNNFEINLNSAYRFGISDIDEQNLIWIKEFMASVPIYNVTIGEFISFLNDLRKENQVLIRELDNYDLSETIPENPVEPEKNNKNENEKENNSKENKEDELDIIVEDLNKEKGTEFTIKTLKSEIIKIQTKKTLNRFEDERFQYFLENCSVEETKISNDMMFTHTFSHVATEIFRNIKLKSDKVCIVYEFYSSESNYVINKKLEISSLVSNESALLNGLDVIRFLRVEENSFVLEIMKDCGLFDITIQEFFEFLFTIFNCFGYHEIDGSEPDSDEISRLLNSSVQLKNLTAKSARSTLDTYDDHEELPKKVQKLN